MIQVGQRIPNSKKKNPKYLYSDCEYNSDGWADSSKYLPENFDLVFLKDENGKMCTGWYAIQSWYGLKMKSKNIKFWKRKLDELL